VLAGIFFAFNFFTDYYYGLFLSVFIIIFFSVWVFVARESFSPDVHRGFRMTLKPIIIFGLVSVLLIGSYLGLIFLSGGKEAGQMVSFARPVEDLYRWGVPQLKFYFIPWQENYLLGNFWNRVFYDGKGIPDGEWLVYLGWPGLLLAGYGVWRWRRQRNNQSPRDNNQIITNNQDTITKANFDFVMILFIVTAIAATIFSFAPPLSPSKWIYEVLPQFRVYARFFVLVSLSISVLAGVGMKYLFEMISEWLDKGILRRFAPQNDIRAKSRFKFYVLSIILIAVLVDFAPSFKTTDVSKVPEEYVWLKGLSEKTMGSFVNAQDDNSKIVIVEYPYVNTNISPTPTYLFWQRYHQKPMINGQPEPDPTGKEKIRHLIYDITNPRTPRILKKLGATYLILHKDQYNKPYWEGAPIPPDKKLPRLDMKSINPGLKLVKKFNLTYVYEIK
jgi:hypothetical protein